MIHSHNKKSSTAVAQRMQSCPTVTGCAVAGRRQERVRKKHEREEKGEIRKEFRQARESNTVRILEAEG